MQRFPRWATPERRTHLVHLFHDSKGFCVRGHFPCLVLEHQYEVFSEELIADWKAEDREERQDLWRVERERMHSDQGRIRQGRFDSVAREIYHARHPACYLEGIGMSGLTLKRVAKVRIACSSVRLWVDLPSKNARRKARRYRRAEAASTMEAIVQAVRDYQASH